MKEVNIISMVKGSCHVECQDGDKEKFASSAGRFLRNVQGFG